MTDTTFIDFETHYTQDYNLKKLNYYQYIQDHRFSILGAAIIHNNEPAQWLTGLDLATLLDELRYNPPEAVVAHNTLFDGLILTQLGVTTELWVDTLSMARALLPPGTPLSLDALAKRYHLGQKLEGLPMGIASWDELSPEAQRRLKVYAINDVELLQKLYQTLAPQFPSQEFELIDLTLRMAFKPHLQLNMPLAQQLLASVGDRKTRLINESGLSEKVLSSNKQFSEWLLANNYDVPMKVSPTTGKQTPALGKSDQAFLDLLEDNPELEPVIEARLAVKSTLETTRLTTLIETQQLMRGVPVPLKYYGGHTGRWSGLFYNLQNLPKKSEIRNTLEAPEGETLIIVDSSAIEARVLAWLTGQEFALTAYKNNEDLYKVMAGKIYNKEPTKVTKDERTLGKIAVLGCLASDTQVLTDMGWKPIIAVSISDKLWDGVSWVRHKGLIYQGQQTVITQHGVTMTPDHLVLTPVGWRKWEDTHTNHSLMDSATKLVNLPSKAGSKDSPLRAAVMAGIQSWFVHVVGPAWYSVKTLLKEKLPVVIPALNVNQQILENIIGVMRKYSRITTTELAYSTDSLPASDAAIAQPTHTTTTMESEEYPYTNHGEKIAGPFSTTFKRFLTGISQNMNWIASTWMAITNQVISDSYPNQPTFVTNEKSPHSNIESQNSNKKIPVYDLSYCGPNNRFTILSNKGPLLVHNCGYGMGFNKFVLTCKTYGVTISEELAQTTIDTYRETYNLVRNLWRTFNSYIQIMTTDFAEKSGKTPWLKYTAPNETPWLEYTASNETLTTLIFTTEKIRLPNGLALHYPNLHQNNQGEYVYGLKNSIKKVYGAKVVENIVQALARNIIAKQMLDAYKTLPGTLVLSVHDEIVVSTKTQHAESVLQDLITIMKTPPNWASTCPLDAEGSISKFYKK
jgi:DNA polymerase I-like protein with 3'-5' exonuclease and polymerase domains